MSNYKTYAEREFRAAGWLDENGKFNDEMQEAACKHVLALLEVFAEEGHSGSSALYVIDIFTKLVGFKPLTPITCSEDEWAEVGENMYQNTRLAGLFKDGEEGRPYYLNAVVFREKDGSCFTGFFRGASSCQYVRLPFTPKTFYINVDSWEVNKDDDNIEEPGSGWWEHSITDLTQLEEVFMYYDDYSLPSGERA